MEQSRIIEQIHNELKNGTVPWTKPWVVRPDSIISYATGKPYTSVLNRMMLSYAGEWATYAQIKKLGGQVKKGEHGCPIRGSGTYTETNEDTGEEKTRHCRRLWWVFRVGSQTEGLEPKWPERWGGTPQQFSDDEPYELVKQYCERSDINLMFGGSQAFYSRSDDAIQVPNSSDFSDRNRFWHTVFHELVHSTGHKSRLARDRGSVHGTSQYAREELVADIGSALCMGQFGMDVENSIPDTAAYCRNWATVIGSLNEHEFSKIVSQAEAAMKFIFNINSQE